jgi:cell division protein FtsI (penicillin-binding protein 3)
VSNRREQILTRMKYVAVCVGVVYAGLVWRAVDLQVLRGDVFRALADEQQNQTLKTLPQRGEIVDRDGEPLAVSLRVDSAFANPGDVKDPERTAAAISAITKQDRRKLAKLLRKDAKFVWVARQLDAPVAAKLRAAKLPGIGFAPETKRYYPNNALMGQALGFVGLDANGLEGIEKRYDGYIKGESEVVRLQRDALNRGILINQIEESLPKAGHRVELTVDKAIAHEAQKSLDAAVLKYRALNGVAVAQDVDTGAILAMVASPPFDPNRYKSYPVGYGRNRAVADIYEPGSTMKAVLYAAALQEKVLNAGTPIFCENGVYRVADRTIRDTHQHGTLTASEVVKFSSNIGALKIGRMLGRETWFRYIEAFGLTAHTDIDLPGEAASMLRPVERWNEVLFANTTYGQGIGTTPLQVVNAVSTLANGGKLMRPYIVQRIVDAKGGAVYEAEPEVRRQAVEPWVAARVRETLETVVEEEGGTGSLAMVPGYRVAGKTGTSQKIDPETGTYSRTRYMSTFVGFLPARDPRVSILVLVNEPQGEIYGGIVAAPVFAAIATKAMERLHVPPDLALAPAAQEEPAAPAFAEDGTGETRFAGLTIREALRQARAQGITLRPRGTGVAAKERCDGAVCDVVFKPL